MKDMKDMKDMKESASSSGGAPLPEELQTIRADNLRRLTPDSCVVVAAPVLSPCPAAASSARRCHSIYKGFAQCLMALGDSLADSARRNEDTHEIHSICRSVEGSAGLLCSVLVLLGLACRQRAQR
ncbi:hypothetical protein EYF80_025573 [Liparis tanakae]|uniref:Neuritin-like protein n=1 Tax=Liparis tanakae TaxID=230148 RepID=A0A4Z2HG46_9TELE|nr:hypothetical protein EYF80_025573 [Liparis tanakae]